VAIAHGSLTPAATAGRRSVSAGCAFAAVVKLLASVGVHRLVGKAHHRVREKRPPILRNRCATCARGADEDQGESMAGEDARSARVESLRSAPVVTNDSRLACHPTLR
jgi:hypothetical protein